MASKPLDTTGAEAHFNRGLGELHRYLFYFEETALPRAVDAFRLATTLDTDQAAYWAALGFALDASDLPDEAMIVLRRANEIDPEDEEVEVFVLTLLSELGPEPEAMAAVEALAKRKGVDLDLLRQELANADMSINARAFLMNGFLRARNFLRSTLEDAIERSHGKSSPEEYARQTEADLQECFEMQEELQKDFDAGRVPNVLHDVGPWAVRLGVGDDVCRSTLFERLTSDERSTLFSVIDKHASSINSWLDMLEGKPMTIEAAAFMYLLLGVEETNFQAP